MNFASTYACDDCVCGLTDGCNRTSRRFEPEALIAALALDGRLFADLETVRPVTVSGQTHRPSLFRRFSEAD